MWADAKAFVEEQLMVVAAENDARVKVVGLKLETVVDA